MANQDCWNRVVPSPTPRPPKDLLFLQHSPTRPTHQLPLHVLVPRRANENGVLHEAHEAPEGVAFILDLSQQGGHQVRHALTVAHVGIKHCIVEQNAPAVGERSRRLDVIRDGSLGGLRASAEICARCPTRKSPMLSRKIESQIISLHYCLLKKMWN